MQKNRLKYPTDGVEVMVFDRQGHFLESYDTLGECAAAHGIKIQKLLALIYYDDSYQGLSYDIPADAYYDVEMYVDQWNRERFRIALT